MKVQYSNELKSRLISAAANGSKIAGDILVELKSNRDASEIIKGSANFFSTKRKRQSADEFFYKLKIVFTACTKDITNENFPDRENPQAPWFAENRTEVDASTFLKYFKNLPDYSDEELMFFINAICVDSKVTFKLQARMSDFAEAYDEANYSPSCQYGTSTLHGSCMRHEGLIGNVADFYHNFARAQIIVAYDSHNQILGRAIVWKDCVDNETGIVYSVLDRVYSSYSFIITMMYDFAASQGIQLRKTVNDYSHKTLFTSLVDIESLGLTAGQPLEENLYLSISVPAAKWHKKGAPYLDTFTYLHASTEGELELSNNPGMSYVAHLDGTNGYACRSRYYCASCGKTHSDGRYLCTDCRSEILLPTFFGDAIIGKVVEYKKEKYPASLFKGNKPKKNLDLFLKLEKLYNN